MSYEIMFHWYSSFKWCDSKENWWFIFCSFEEKNKNQAKHFLFFFKIIKTQNQKKKKMVSVFPFCRYDVLNKKICHKFQWNWKFSVQKAQALIKTVIYHIRIWRLLNFTKNQIFCQILQSNSNLIYHTKAIRPIQMRLKHQKMLNKDV